MAGVGRSGQGSNVRSGDLRKSEPLWGQPQATVLPDGVTSGQQSSFQQS